MTIVIPFYSALRFLAPAIESVIQQSDPHWQLLVLDDESPEPGVAEVVSRFADPRIRYMRNDQNLGMAANWNAAFEHAHTELVALLHADDLLMPNYVSIMRSVASMHPGASMYYCRSEVVDIDGRRVRSLKEGIKQLFSGRTKGYAVVEGPQGFERLAWANFIMCPTICYRRRRFLGLRFDASKATIPDFDFVVRAVLRGDRIVGVNEYAHRYRRHDLGSATAKYLADLRRFSEDAELLDYMEESARRRGWVRAARIAHWRPILLLHIAYCVVGDFLRLKPAMALQKLRFASNEIARFIGPVYGKPQR